ncbi:MAG: glycine-rich protein [Bacteroidota bacterium]
MKKTFLLFVFILAGCASAFSQGAAVNATGAPAAASAILDVSSITKGMLIPRMTTQQRDSIAAPNEGLIIFNTDSKCFNYFKIGSWFEVCGNCIGPPAPVVGNNGPLCGGQTLNLTASTVPNATYHWTGPNGFSSTQQNPVISNVTTANNGVYSVVLSNQNCSGNPVTTNVTVTSNLSSAFTFTPTIPSVGTNVTFTPSQTGASYSWTFQNGSPSTSTLQNPLVTWSNTGTFTITLVVSQNGCSSGQTSQNILVDPCVHGSITFNYTGSVQTWTVPTCFNSITVDASGAQGGGSNGGLGGRAIATVPVTGGATLYIYVGEQPTVRPGAGSGGFNGGGQIIAMPCGGGSDGWGGGGASDVRTSTSLNDRIIVAGGGGGTGYSGGLGGSGGGLTGGNGAASWISGTQGLGGTQTSGGAGGPYNGQYAGSGSLGQGGDAGPPTTYCTGGGGGGGYYGGGGGYVSAGAGGSSYISYPGSTGTSTTAGYRTGNGVVTITY